MRRGFHYCVVIIFGGKFTEIINNDINRFLGEYTPYTIGL